MAVDNIARGMAARAISAVDELEIDSGIPQMTSATVDKVLSNDGVTAKWVDTPSVDRTPPEFLITLTEDQNNGTYTADRTYNQIKAAYDAGKILAVLVGNGKLPMVNAEVNGDNGAGFTFGYTELRAHGASVVTRAIHYLHSASDDIWSESGSDGEYVQTSGGAMAGPLTLYNHPSNEYEAVSKGYVDNRVFKITFTRDVVAGLNADKTIDEINAAITDNKIVIGVVGSEEYRLAYHGADGIIFSGISGSISTNIMYLNGAWTQTTEAMLPVKGGTLEGSIDANHNKITNIQKIHIDGAAPLYLGSTIEPTGTNGTRLTGTTAGAAAFVKADKQNEYVPVYVGTPTDNEHSANKKYVDEAVAGRLPMVSAQTGQLKAYLQNGSSPDVCLVSDNGGVSSITRYDGSGQIVVNPAPTANNHVTNKKYVDDAVAKGLPISGGTVSGNLMVGGNLTVSGTASTLKAPVENVDICNKAYVDACVADVVRKQSVAVGENSSVNINLANGAYLVTASDNKHGGLVFIAAYPDGVTISGLVNMNGWKCERATGGGVTLTNMADTAMDVYITSIGEGTYA